MNENTNPEIEQPHEDTAPDQIQNGTACKKKGGGKGIVFFFLLLITTGVIAWNTKDIWAPIRKAPIPVPYLITATEYRTRDIGKDGARFTATFKIDIFAEQGWQKIELLPAKVAIVDSDLPRNAYLLLSEGSYYILTDEKGEIEVTLDFAIAPVESDGTFSVMFERVPSVTCSLDARFSEENIDVKVTGAQSVKETETNQTTHVVAILPDNIPINLSWEKSLPEIEQGPSEYYTETRTLVSIAEGLIVGKTRINFTILHTPTRELKMNVPDGVSVLEIKGKGILDWREADGVLEVQMEKEIIGSYTLDIQHESSPDMSKGKMNVPVITGTGVVREKGDIGIVTLTNVEVGNDTATAAEPIDVKDLSPIIVGMTPQPILLAYRYVDPDFKISLDISRHKSVDVLLSIIDKAHASVMQTLDGKRMTRIVYHVRNNRNQFLRIQLPENAKLWSASVARKPVQPARDDKGRLLLPLTRSQSHMSSFPVEIVYAEKGTAPNTKGAGKARIEMPLCSEPIMHMSVSLHVPAKGKYRHFEGSLRKVDQFTAFSHPRPRVMHRRGNKASVNQAMIPHTSPLHAPADIQFPLSGKVLRFEKILIVQDAQWLAYEYTKLAR